MGGGDVGEDNVRGSRSAAMRRIKRCCRSL